MIFIRLIIMVKSKVVNIKYENNLSTLFIYLFIILDFKKASCKSLNLTTLKNSS